MLLRSRSQSQMRYPPPISHRPAATKKKTDLASAFIATKLTRPGRPEDPHRADGHDGGFHRGDRPQPVGVERLAEEPVRMEVFDEADPRGVADPGIDHDARRQAIGANLA